MRAGRRSRLAIGLYIYMISFSLMNCLIGTAIQYCTRGSRAKLPKSRLAAHYWHERASERALYLRTHSTQERVAYARWAKKARAEQTRARRLRCATAVPVDMFRRGGRHSLYAPNDDASQFRIASPPAMPSTRIRSLQSFRLVVFCSRLLIRILSTVSCQC